ncbi:MAG: hypothetical protein ACK4NN_02040 [Rheinheimera sp.]
MAITLVSNQAYSGSLSLPNVIDKITGLPEKTDFLKKLLAADGGDPSRITSENTSSLFDALKTHRGRVVADGGVVLSMAKTLLALIFANTNSIASNTFAAYSAVFGIKVSGNTITKIYDLSTNACDLTALTGTLSKATDSGFDVLKSNATTTYISKTTPFVAANSGIILGGSSHDVDVGTAPANSVRPILLTLNSTGSGVLAAYLEDNQGGTAKLIFTNTSNVNVTVQYDQAGANYKKYAGITGVEKAAGSSLIYENGVMKQFNAQVGKDWNGISLYPAISIQALNSFVRESWVINSNSETLAQALGVYLNKSV